MRKGVQKKFRFRFDDAGNKIYLTKKKEDITCPKKIKRLQILEGIRQKEIDTANKLRPYSIRNDQYKKELKSKATAAEKEFLKCLKASDIRHKFQKGFYEVGFHCIVDFFILGAKIAVEIDGGYHNKAEQVVKDARRTDWLESKRGVKVIRFSNEMVLDNSYICLMALGREFLKIGHKQSHNYKVFSSLLHSE